MSERLVNIGPAPQRGGHEALRIAFSMIVTCVVGASILGAVFIGTDRYQKAATIRTEQNAVVEMLGLDPTASITQIHQYLDPARRQVIYRVQTANAAKDRELVFTLDGVLVRKGETSNAADAKTLRPLGRVFVANLNGVPAGFVVEGETAGYKNRIRFFVAMDPKFEVAGVRVVEHEEDPGLGAEVATPRFQAQYVGRPLAALSRLDVTRDPMPEDWAAALHERSGMSPTAWRTRFTSLLAREQSKPVYAVTGATISSRALTNGVRESAEHFERRWQLLAPYLDKMP